MPLLLAATLAGCASLTGAHPGGVVVTAATAITPSPSWAPETKSFYRPSPVSVKLCRVEGVIEGNIGFELWLPEDWNGRLLGAGVGGDAGIFNYSDMSRRVEQGFATVTTDSGHKASQARWMADAKARVDYEHRAVHLTAVAAKALATTFYGRAVDRSYFTGCSGGGRQALKEMQNYPGDYDGVIAGAPGPYMPLQSVRMMWGALLQKHDRAGALSDDDWALYERKATAACDKIDGVADGVIENPLRCKFKVEALACKPGQSSDCLSPAKLKMLRTIVSPMPDEQGRAMDWGLYPGVRTRPGPPSPLLRAMWADGVYNDANWNEDSFRRTADLQAANRAMPELRADKTAIQPFLKAGGKAILYHGWADPSTNAGPTLGYYASLARAHGGAEKLAESVRLFMVPGMYHCTRGPGADAFGGSGHPSWPNDPQRDVLWALIRWVEQGQAPERLTATKLEGDQLRFTRTLCPFPKAARYNGVGPQEVAASYSCQTDPTLVRTLGASKPR
ncbi:tannase/feruloyl esterase family alpha/beta hydrolase [Sphingomonas sp. IC-56]|uniref:tannase/feruloyl esterase family alpha/beta hydrolase n=1 Tax=Sphingomonas sp. IC-56 TaxID=2898529 RepID=UPI001E378742|nr:tannase/feruloyl esterase family alpha/beta hydrolase [Sphingomonas sp. IC-56]MCD2322866.1 tannase/feruloyl esterase family alpha/beta hydrolase [Sphingomonas sp. IC-56]